ncbi:hypothetical protein [Pseudomonas sp. WC2]|uniref:hypothetical protein n=1 Tax=Pseudomonas sp. WC2 TaxID=3424773 RepID=UPI003D333C3D
MTTQEKKPGVGEFTAEVDGVPFLKTNVVVLHFANEDYFILGYEGDMNKVVFSVPTALPGEGPHKVEHYHDGLQWDVTINERKSLVGSGSTTVTFDKNRDSIEGTIDFTLEDKRKVTGKFNITNKW